MAKRDRGQIRKKGHQKYQLKVYLGRIQGKRKYASKTVNGTRKAAEARLVEWLRSLDTGTFVATADSPRVADALEEFWKDFNRGNPSKSYARTTRNRIDFDMIPLLGHYRTNQLRASIVAEFVEKLQTERPYSIGTLTHCRSALTRFLKWARARDLLIRDPMVGVTWPSREGSGHRGQSLTIEAAQAVLQALRDAGHDHYYILFRTLLETGMRPQEACALQWGDLTETHITIRRTMKDWQAQTTAWVSETGKTENSLGRISIPKGLYKALQGEKVRQHRAALELGLGGDYNPEAWIFLNRDGKTHSQGAMQYIWKQYGPDGTRMYDLRHTHATLLIESGVEASVVQARLRHQRISTTLDTYTHARQALDDRATEAWEQTFSSSLEAQEGPKLVAEG